MSQHDFNIGNDTAPAVRGDINNALVALATLSSGTSAPSTTYANMLWYDTTNNIVYMRNEADSAWIELFTLDQVSNKAAAAVGGTLATIENITPVGGDIMYWDGAAWVRLGVGASNTALRSNGSVPYWGQVVVTAGAGQLVGAGYNQTDGRWIAGNYGTLGAGAVGTLGFLRNEGYGATVSPGTQIAGSSLKWGNAGGGALNLNPAGSWRALGTAAPSYTTTTDLRVTLYMRYA